MRSLAWPEFALATLELAVRGAELRGGDPLFRLDVACAIH
jgi:hypothetical protein